MFVYLGISLLISSTKEEEVAFHCLSLSANKRSCLHCFVASHLPKGWQVRLWDRKMGESVVE